MNLSEFDDRFLASFVLGLPDYDAQLYAIRNLLGRHSRADRELSKEIEKIDAFAKRASASASERAVDERVDYLNQFVFQGAAHSMAAVGMLAPFTESLFKQAFAGIRDRFNRLGRAPKGHVRWTMSADKQWNCSYVSRPPGQKHLVNGVIELADAVGLASDLPPELWKTLSALFAYRNKMFHLGFEWPNPQLAAFEKRIKAEDWEHWFNQASSDGKAWIFYLNDSFVNHCLTTMEQIFSSLGAFVRRND